MTVAYTLRELSQADLEGICELVELISAWPTLPDFIKQAVLLLVRGEGR